MAERIGNERLGAFCDAIFAIAITLLVLEIHVPEIDAIGPGAPLGSVLAAEWPSWFAVLLTFLTLFIAWTNHHHALAQLGRTSSAFIYANGLLMLSVVISPFAAGVLGKFLDTESAKTAIIFYCFANLFQNLGWVAVFHVAARSPLAKGPVQQQRIESNARVVTFTFAMNLAILALAFYLPIVALILVTGAWLFYLYAGLFWTPIGRD